MALITSDPDTLWLNIINGTLGVVVLICVLVLVGGVVYEFVARARRRNAIIEKADDQMRALLGAHGMKAPGLGWTAADGGEPIDGKQGPR